MYQLCIFVNRFQDFEINLERCKNRYCLQAKIVKTRTHEDGTFVYLEIENIDDVYWLGVHMGMEHVL